MAQFYIICFIKLTVMSNQEKKKIDDDEFIQNLDNAPLEDDDIEDDDVDDLDDEDEDDEEFKENLDSGFPLSGGETEL